MTLAALVLASIMGGPHVDRDMVIVPEEVRAPHCRAIREKVIGDQRAYFERIGRTGKRLRGQYAVMRTINGCSVPAPMGYHPTPAAPETSSPGQQQP